jgi:hypothetical protein
VTWVSRRVLVVWHSRVKLRTSRGGDVCGYALDLGLRQLAGCAGAEWPRLLACLVDELLDDALGRGAHGGNLR